MLDGFGNPEATEASDKLAAALSYAALGRRIFPVHSLVDGVCTCHKGASCPEKTRGKHPCTAHGFTDATVDPEKIRFWWTVLYPFANIGIVTGKVSGIVVIDADVGTRKDGTPKVGLESLEALMAEMPDWPDTEEVRSGGGGRHLYFVYPELAEGLRIGSSASKLAPDLDVRANGGYIIAAHSSHRSGNRYTPVNDLRPAPMPAALVERLLARTGPKRPAARTAEGRKAVVGTADARCRRTIAAALSHIGADDYDTWVKVGAALRRGGLPIEVWEKWSATSDKYLRGDCDLRWEGFDREERDNATLGSVFYLAREGGWEGDLRRTQADLDPDIAAVTAELDAIEKRVGEEGFDAADAATALMLRESEALAHIEDKRNADYRAMRERFQALTGANKTDFDRDVKDASAERREVVRAALAENTPALGLATNRRGAVIPSVGNAVRVLLGHPDWVGLFRHNEFRQCVEKADALPGVRGLRVASERGPLTDNDYTHFRNWFEAVYGAQLSEPEAARAIAMAASQHGFNPAQDALRGYLGLWDGVERLRGFLLDYLDADPEQDGGYLAELGYRWMIGVVARVMRPGCQRDEVLVLQGVQGNSKSSFARCLSDAIAPDAFIDALPDLHSPEAAFKLAGVVIAELGEGIALRRNEADSVKAFLTGRTDSVRPPYGRNYRTQARTVSFVLTTNDSEFLRDATGNRRFWPVRLSRALDIGRIAAVMPQLLGEAMAAFEKGERWHITDESVLAAVETIRDDCHISDSLEERVQAVITGRPSFDPITRSMMTVTLAPEELTAGRVLGYLFDGSKASGKAEEMRVADILKRRHFKKQRISVDGAQIRVWTPTERTPKDWLRG